VEDQLLKNITRLRKNCSRLWKSHTIATWIVRTMSQGNSDIVKLEMERTRTDILDISELRWKGIGFFNSDEYSVYYCGNQKCKENGVAITGFIRSGKVRGSQGSLQ